MVRDRASSYNSHSHSDQELSKSRRASKSHQWFKSYGHFTEGVDLAYWWSFSGGGSAINEATPSSFFICPVQAFFNASETVFIDHPVLLVFTCCEVRVLPSKLTMFCTLLPSGVRLLKGTPN